MHTFDQALELQQAESGRYAGRTHAAYANMVGPFGGLTNALMLHAALLHPQRRGEPVALTVNFAAPVAAGAFELQATPTRTNRSTQHWVIAQRQGAETVTSATAVFAERRDTWTALDAPRPVDGPGPTDLPRATGKGLPPWLQSYDMRFLEGELPALDGTEQASSVTRLWIRDDPPRAWSFSSLAAICDCFYPRVYLRRHRISAAGTISMTSYFHADEAMLLRQGNRHVYGVARGVNYRRGYFDQSAEIWDDSGKLLASSHQLVYFRDERLSGKA